MTETSTVVDASMLAHGLHVSFVLLGVWGLAALLLPQALERRAALRPAARSRTPYAAVDLDEHARRVAELRQAVVAGALPAPTQHLRTTPLLAAPARQPVLGLPLALVTATTAAGIHAAVALPHLTESVLFGAFFLLAAGAQLAWVAQLATRPSPAVLRTGILLHLALVALWLLTRVAGLPFGLMPEPHPVGGWDVACALWQLTCVLACARSLRGTVPDRMPEWLAWHPSTRGAVGASAVVLVLLTVVGAHS